MPGRPHHTEKMRRCVEHVKGKGHDESSAYAICTTSMRNAGEVVYEGRHAELRSAGDTPGHPFHGNQYTDGQGEGNALEHTKESVVERAQDFKFKPAKQREAKAHNPNEYRNGERIGAEGQHIRQFLEEVNNFLDVKDQDAYIAGWASTFYRRKSDIYGHEKTFRGSEEGDDGMRELHLCGATGEVRYEELNGRRHLVVPVVALMEGVIHPVNADTPEFVPAEVLRKAAASWVGKPVTLGHPKRNGTQCSASDSAVRKEAGIGVIFKSDFTGKKLLQEAWIDEEKAKELHPEMYAALAAGGREEVSVGAFAVTREKASSFNGKPYKAEWLETLGDHLAFLPGGRGACSCDMGCGTHRAAQMHLVTAEAIELLPDFPVQTFTTLEGLSLEERISAVGNAVYKKWPAAQNETATPYSIESAYPIQVFDDRVIVRRGPETYSCSYAIDKDGNVTLGEAVEVKQAWVEAAGKFPAAYKAKKNQKECAMCRGLGTLKNNPCDACGGEGYTDASTKHLAGARHSNADMRMIQAVHDHATALGASCSRTNLETAQEAAPPISAERIRREGTKWALYSADLKRVLAHHNNEDDAKQQLDALLAKCG